MFDEVDAGIGGQTARAVGERLRALAAGRQVLCITHLPQIASLADRHFRIAKDRSAQTARTTVTRCAADVVGELVRMLGADGGRRGGAPPRQGAAEGGMSRRPVAAIAPPSGRIRRVAADSSDQETSHD